MNVTTIHTEIARINKINETNHGEYTTGRDLKIDLYESVLATLAEDHLLARAALGRDHGALALRTAAISAVRTLFFATTAAVDHIDEDEPDPYPSGPELDLEEPSLLITVMVSMGGRNPKCVIDDCHHITGDHRRLIWHLAEAAAIAIGIYADATDASVQDVANKVIEAAGTESP